MSVITEETAGALLAALQAKQQPQVASPVPAIPAAMPGMQQANGFAMPGMPGMIPAAAMQPMNGFGQPQLSIQPKAIAITINYPLPDGSQLPIDIHFDPAYMQNLQGFAQLVYQTFGQALRTFQARNQFGAGWNQGGGGGGWNGGGGGRGRRW
jgi:hypothetical protein